MTQPGKPSGRLTLETLLRVKRAEHPDPGFWDEWECELRRRQLASAIVVPPPWYRRWLLGWRPAAAVAVSAVFAVFLLVKSRPGTGTAVPRTSAEQVAAAVYAVDAFDSSGSDSEVYAEASFVVDVLSKPIVESAPRRFLTLAAVETLRSEPADSAQYADFTWTYPARGGRL